MPSNADCINSRIPELEHLKNIILLGRNKLETQIIARVSHKNSLFPIHAVTLGSQDCQHPAIAFIAGVHGIERIGTQVVLAMLENLVKRLAWDDSLAEELKSVRLVFIPLVNPVGMLSNRRANGNGIDLMRNAPIDADEAASYLVGGQRYSAYLPWYRGKQGQVMQTESHALTQYIHAELLPRPFSMVLDCHSGFGLKNRIWFPYAKSKHPITHIGDIYRLQSMLQDNYPHQDYLFEPQSRNYTTHGDLWDHLYLQSLAQPENTFIPLTLEMGSWNWIKKNPLQIFQKTGIFHPIQPHRVKRVLRQHHVLMEFLIKATRSYQNWNITENQVEDTDNATTLWY